MSELPRVMINPSCQYKNQIFDGAGNEVYNEGHNLWHFAVAVKKYLDADGRSEAFISRNSQTCESDLDSEANLTNQLGCACLVALHSDATPDGSPGGGTWTFYKTEKHLEPEEIDNHPYPLSESRRLADLVQTRTLTAVRAVYPQVKDKGVQEHWVRLRMLHKPQCPSCLIEILFHSHPTERELLKDSDFQDRIGKAIAAAILEYLFP